MSRFAIGDIHGCSVTLMNLLNTLGPGEGDTLIFLGDYVDRGPDSKGVLDQLMALPSSGIQTICLKGNHEVLMEKALPGDDPAALDVWFRNGGEQTLQSYGLSSQQTQGFPQHYSDWIASLPTSYLTGSWICVHAGLNLQIEDPLSDEHSLMWIRNWFGEQALARHFPGKRVLHGHTPLPRWIIEKTQESRRQALDLDCGCVYKGRNPDMGWLCAYDLDRDLIFFEPNQDM